MVQLQVLKYFQSDTQLLVWSKCLQVSYGFGCSDESELVEDPEIED